MACINMARMARKLLNKRAEEEKLHEVAIGKSQLSYQYDRTEIAHRRLRKLTMKLLVLES